MTKRLTKSCELNEKLEFGNENSKKMKSTVTPGRSTVTPQKRRSLVDEVEILSSSGEWTGLAKRRKTSTVLPAPSTSQPAIAKREGRPPKNTIRTLTLPK
ncbi:hypothetical protein CALVIDRAFT_569392 [Calocera viscosa TUFC12733]|uniref:Uncharacterized protein n=1 Tax=Calocera viscosa (strain TUFC12733) TaxID=1330018 RepID=A0A167G1D4_CALVF|nr:hypothetical protein CALVIDRAFT_569392 [Calocera viscosa TUFC12733]